MYHPFSVAETLKTAWDIFKKNFAIIVVYSSLAVVILFLVGLVNLYTSTNKNFTSMVIIFLILMFIQGYSTLGLYKLIFTLIDSEYYEFEVMQIVPKVRMVIAFILIGILLGFMVVNYRIFIGQAFDNNLIVKKIAQVVEELIVFYIALRCMFCICYIVDDNSGTFESLKQSYNLTKNNLLKILLITVINFLLVAVPILSAFYYDIKLLYMSIIITYPFINIVLAVTYRKLVYSHKDIDDNFSDL